MFCHAIEAQRRGVWRVGSTYLHVYKPWRQYAPLAVHDLLRPPALPKEQPRLDHHAIAHPEVFAVVEGTVA